MVNLQPVGSLIPTRDGANGPYVGDVAGRVKNTQLGEPSNSNPTPTYLSQR